MKAKDKAMEIAMKFDKKGETDNAKQCALICVDEMIRVIKKIQFNNNLFLEDKEIRYWWEVRQEINKI
jgi:hypothetical protein